MSELFDNGFPVLKPDMLEPANAPILAAAAKKLYGNWMLAIGMYEKEAVANRVADLSEALKAHQENLHTHVVLALEEVISAREDMATLRDAIAEQRGVISALQRTAEDPATRSKATAVKLRAAEAALEQMQDGAGPKLQEALSNLKSAKAESSAYRKDKRQFLVDYINNEVRQAKQAPHRPPTISRKAPDTLERAKEAKRGRKEGAPRPRRLKILLSVVGVIAAAWLIAKLISSPGPTNVPHAAKTASADQAALNSEAAFRQFLAWRVSRPDAKAKAYAKALQEISVRGSTLLLSLSTRDYRAAVELCNIALLDWPGRNEHGIARVKVVLSSSRYSILAESGRKASGEEMCR